MSSFYTRYYLIQSGGNSHLHRTSNIRQDGRGVGSFFRGLARYGNPVVSAGTTTLKRHAVKAGKAILSGIGKKPIRTILRERIQTAVRDLAQKGINKLYRDLDTVVINKRSVLKRTNPFKVKKSKTKSKRRKYSKGKKVIRKSQSVKLGKKPRKSVRKRVTDIFDK